MLSLLKKEKWGFLLVYSGNFASSSLIFMSSIIVARALGASGYGQLAIIQAVFTIISGFIGIRVSEALSRNLVRFQDAEGDRIILTWLCILIEFFIFLFSFCISVTCFTFAQDLFLDETELPTSLIALYGLSLVHKVVKRVWNALARHFDYFYWLASLPVIMSCIRLLVLGIMAFVVDLELDLYSFVLTLMLLSLVEFLIMGFLIFRWSLNLSSLAQILTKPPLYWQKFSPFLKMLKSGFLTLSFTDIVKKSDILILGFWSSDGDVGCYKIAKSIISFIQQPFHIISKLMFKNFSVVASTGKDLNLFDKMLSKSLSYATPIALVFLAIGVTVYYLVPYVYGEEFGRSTKLVWILMTGVYFSVVLFWVSSFIVAIEELSLHVKITLATSIVTILLYFFVTPSHGATGVASCLSFAWALGHLLILVGLKTKFDKRPRS